MDDKKLQLDELLVKHKVQPFGMGYIDCIVMKENLSAFLADLDDIGIDVTGVSMWCHCTDENITAHGCPHGGAYSPSRYHDGYFSEMYHMEFKNEIDSSADVLAYVFSECESDEFYVPCVQPGLWLDVPDDWRNTEYIVPAEEEEDETMKVVKKAKSNEKEINNMVLLVSICSFIVNAFLITVFPLPSFAHPGFWACGIICGVLGLRMKVRHADEELARGKKIREFVKMFFLGLAVYFGVAVLLAFTLIPIIYIISC